MKKLVLLSAAVVMLGISSCGSTCPAYSHKANPTTEQVTVSAAPVQGAEEAKSL